MRALFPLIGYAPQQFHLNRIRRFAGGHAGTVAHPKDMRIHSDGGISKRFIQQVEEADSKSSEMDSEDNRALDDRRSGDRRGTGGSLELA